MVAFAGRRYAARSIPVFVADSAQTVTSFTLVRSLGPLFSVGFLLYSLILGTSWYYVLELRLLVKQVLEFQKGTLQNLFWKKYGCDACSGDSFVCMNNTDCAIRNSKCKGNGGSLDCNIGIQLAFSGTDKNDDVLNSWYEVSNLRQYSLYALYSDLRDSLTSPFKNLFWRLFV